MIEVRGLTKTTGTTTLVDHVSFSAHPGLVTAVLGPPESGKSLIAKLILGLAHPTYGEVTVNGRDHTTSPEPLRDVGAVLDVSTIHPSRTARRHLEWVAATADIDGDRVSNVLDMVGLFHVADRKVKTFTTGMVQRLALATALLGDPRALILDEPGLGMNPAELNAIHALERDLAASGRTVLLFSRVLSEVVAVCDHLVLLARGRVLADAPLAEILRLTTGRATRVRSPQATLIAATFAGPYVTVTPQGVGSIVLNGVGADQVEAEAVRRGWTVWEIMPLDRSLDDVYNALCDPGSDPYLYESIVATGLVPEPGGPGAGAGAAGADRGGRDGYAPADPEAPSRAVSETPKRAGGML